MGPYALVIRNASEFLGVSGQGGYVEDQGLCVLKVVLSAADGVAQRSQRPQHQSDHEHDQSKGPENRDAQHETEKHKDQTKDCHLLFPLCSERSSRPSETFALRRKP